MGTACCVLCFASYQAFVFVYVTMCIFGFILLCEDGTKRSNLKTIVKLLISFAVSFTLYEFIIRYLLPYLRFDNAVHWYTESKRQIILTLLNKNVAIGSGTHYNLGYIVGIVLCIGIIIYKLVKENDTIFNKILYTASFLMLFLSPFFLAFVQGGVPLLRSQLALPYTEAFLIMFCTYYLFKNKVLKYIPLVVIFCVFCAQMSITQRYYNTDIFKTEFEVDLSKQIIHELKSRGIEEKSKLVFIGHIDTPFNDTCKTGEIVGVSSYSANHYAYPYYFHSTGNILGLWRCLGYDYTSCTEEEITEARHIVENEEIPCWPKEGCIKDCGEYYLIKLSEDDLPW